MKRKLSNLFYYLFVSVLVLLIAVIVIGRWQGMHMLAVLSGSMEPDLSVGSIVVTLPVDVSTLKPGDDVSYVLNKNKTIVTHRVIEVDTEERLVITKGIANNVSDKPIRSENIVGKVVLCIPMLGYVLIWFQNIKVKIIGIIIVATVILRGAITPKKKSNQ